ncbi:MAG: redoxin domain-containing protein, partial [Hydrogenophaga sp.]|nr:redoxin domain-containing protein [Hydrogenophaga sp.]
MLQRRQFTTLSATALGALALPASLLPRVAQAASVGQPAPDFTLSDTAGKPVKLSQYKGKPVVLEWNNPGCPFVRKHYQGNMQALQKEFTAQGVVWLAVNSTRDDSADHLSPAQLARWMTEQKANPTATLMDEDGTVGMAYGARVTPHMYVVNPQGVLVYAGAIDSIPSARVADIEKATNFVRQGL